MVKFFVPLLLVVLSAITVLVSRSIERSYYLLFLAIFWVIFMPWSYKRSIKKYVRRMYSEGKNKRLICKHKLSIAPEGIVETTDIGEASIRWSAVEKVESSDKYIFIYTSAVGAIIVPRGAFPDDSKYSEFIETVKRYRG